MPVRVFGEQAACGEIFCRLSGLIGTTTVFSELKDSLDEIWYVQRTRQSSSMSLIRTRLLLFWLILALAFLLLTSLMMSAALALLANYMGSIWISVTKIFSPLFAFAVIASLFASIFKMLLQTKLSWRDIWIGSIGTATLFVLDKYLIGIYLGNSGIASSYGARRFSDCTAAVDLLLGKNFLFRRAIHAPIRVILRQSAHLNPDAGKTTQVSVNHS